MSIARLKEYLRRKRGHSRLLLPFKKAELPERQVSLNCHLAYTHTHTHTHTHTPCTPQVLFFVQPEKSLLAGTNFVCVATSSPCYLPAFKSEWRHHLAQTPKDDDGGKHHAFSQCVYVLRTLTWETCGRKENTDGTAPACFREVSRLSRFQRTGRWKSPQALRHEHESEHFSQGGCASHAYDRAVGDAELLSASLTNGK